MPSRAAQQPNIIYIMLDEWGYCELSGLGHADLQTPNIDKQFLDGGMRLTQALAGKDCRVPVRSE